MKKRLLILLPLFLLVACGENKENLSAIKYQYGENAIAIQQDLQNKLQSSSEQNAWSQFQIKENASFKVNISMPSLDESMPASSLEFKGDLDLDVKLGYSVDANSTPSVQSNLKAFAKFEETTTMGSEATSSKIEMNLDAKYGVNSIKLEQNSEPITTDFLFAKITQTIDETSNTYGVLLPNLMSSLQTPPQQSQVDETLVEGDTAFDFSAITSLLTEAGFAKNGENQYYLHFDLNKLSESLNDMDASLAAINLNGNYYVAITFNEDNTLKSIETQGDKISMKMAQEGSSFEFELNTGLSLSEYTGKIDLPTQKDVDDLGYENLIDLAASM